MTVLLSVVCLVNTLLLLAVIRRLNEQNRMLREGVPAGGRPPQGWPPPMAVEAGQRIGTFRVASLDGEVVASDELEGEVLVGFLAPGCQACDASLPGFVERARATPGGRDRVLAVVMGDGAAAAEVHERLAPVARVLAENEEEGPLATAFGVGALPAFAVLSGSTLVASHSLIDRLGAPAT
ncbi:TlpA family protein disulfide reductase [Actinomadura kijaniata]|uniref:TlpA family protein disulfide reductase n=1 Tax=Actinomadura kijaniata TaxID=46161 RepID=UPI003F1C7D47